MKFAGENVHYTELGLLEGLKINIYIRALQQFKVILGKVTQKEWTKRKTEEVLRTEIRRIAIILRAAHKLQGKEP